VPKGHKCGRLHGHGFEVIIRAHRDTGGETPPTDYEHLDELWAPLHRQLDHAYLNDIPGLHNPTSERIAKWIWDDLNGKRPQITSVTVKETAGCGAQFDGASYRIWKDVSLDCAVRLKRAPAGDQRRAIHGHTYTLRLHLSAPLDRVMGWVVDFGDVKALFDPLLQRLDHHPLHEIDGIADADVGSLARYIRSETAVLLPSLSRVDLFSTGGCGAIFSWS
jgi:6-pyruvoyltetrahydropterin/6-carboxytetrahydropterin synthase